MQASHRLRRPACGIWQLENSGWVLLEDGLALGIASVRHVVDG
jgi:hypothetical protein